MASVKYEYFDDYKRKLNEEDTFKEALKDYYDLEKISHNPTRSLA